jgi:molybdenum cofactor biosynthesis enzyme MoaA
MRNSWLAPVDWMKTLHCQRVRWLKLGKLQLILYQNSGLESWNKEKQQKEEEDKKKGEGIENTDEKDDQKEEGSERRTNSNKSAGWW